MTNIPEPVICGRQRYNVTENKILGLGKQTVPYRCPNVATVPIPDEDPACENCAELLRDLLDSGKLSRLAQEITATAMDMPYRTELYDWLVTYATEIDNAAAGLDPKAAGNE